MFEVGFAYLDLGATAKPHLWVVFAAPATDHYQRVIVSFVSDVPHMKDRFCELKAGDHDFIKHDSLALYQKSAIVTSGALNSWMNRGEVQIKSAFSDELIARIRGGALKSPYTPGDVKQAIKVCPWQPKP